MKATIIESVMGVLGFNGEGRLVEWVPFPRDVEKVAEKLLAMDEGKLTEELVTLIKKMTNKGYKVFVFEKESLSRAVKETLNVEVEVETPSKAGEILRENLGSFAVNLKFVEEEAEIRGWIHRVSMAMSSIRLRRAIEKRDLLIIQVINAIDDVEKTLNLFMSRLREWYGLHFPELSRLIEKHETYVRLVKSLVRRGNFEFERLVEEGLPKKKAEQVSEAAEASIGADLYEEDLERIREFCDCIVRLYTLRDELERYLGSLMEEVAPNLYAITGATLGARLIALAGGLGNLSKMPASTIQVLGAEKALFRSLRTGSRPPKHGVIFQHRFLHESKRWQRGKVARVLAGKIAIAARIDAYSGRYMGDRLRRELEEKVKEIKEKYPKPRRETKVKVRAKGRRRRTAGGRSHKRRG